MNQGLWIFVIVVSILCIIASIGILAYFLQKTSKKKAVDPIEQEYTTRWWLIPFWALYYIIIGLIILYQAQQGLPNRYIGDITFVLGPPVFMVIVSVSRHRERKRRILATARVKAKVVGKKSFYSKKSKRYSAIYEFYAEGRQHMATSSELVAPLFGTDILTVKKGEEVELFYIPGHPDMIYVPKEVRINHLFDYFLYFIGIGFPIIALLGPLIPR